MPQRPNRDTDSHPHQWRAGSAAVDLLSFLQAVGNGVARRVGELLEIGKCKTNLTPTLFDLNVSFINSHCDIFLQILCYGFLSIAMMAET